MELVVVAKIGAPHGIKGGVRLQIMLEDPNLLSDLRPLILKDGTEIKFNTIRPQNQNFVAHIKGITDRNDAEKLKNREIYVDKTLLPEPEEDEFYYSDLEGLIAKDTNSAEIGVVTGLMDFGAGDLIEVKLNETGKRELFPFSKLTVPTIDMAQGFLVLDIPDVLEIAPEE